MATTNTSDNHGQLDSETLDKAFESVAIRLKENGADSIEIVVCSGSALILTGMVPRTTKDVDIVALAKSGVLRSPDPLPDALREAAAEAAEDIDPQPTGSTTVRAEAKGASFKWVSPPAWRNDCIPNTTVST